MYDLGLSDFPKRRDLGICSMPTFVSYLGQKSGLEIGV